MDEPTSLKTCTRCKVGKSLDDFHRDKSRPSGRVPRCKTCMSEIQARRYAETVTDESRATSAARSRARRAALPEDRLEELRRRSREYIRTYQHPDPVAREKYQAEYRRQNKQVLAAYGVWYREQNREAILEYAREYRRRNPEKFHEAALRRRALLVTSRVGPVDLAALWTGLCGLCGDVLDSGLNHPDPMSKSVDHIVPLAKGGSHTQDNLQWAHLICNVRKGAATPHTPERTDGSAARRKSPTTTEAEDATRKEYTHG